MGKEIENSQVEQLENIVYLEHREKRMKNLKKIKEFVKPVFSSALFFIILRFPLLVMAKENGNPPPAEPSKTTNNAASVLYLAANICTGIYQLWRSIDNPSKTYPEFLKECVEMAIRLFDKTSQCPAPPPAGGPKPGGPPPAFLNSLKSSPYAMGGSILLIALLFVSASLNSKEKEEKK
jgi:hypothetical protein